MVKRNTTGDGVIDDDPYSYFEAAVQFLEPQVHDEPNAEGKGVKWSNQYDHDDASYCGDAPPSLVSASSGSHSSRSSWSAASDLTQSDDFCGDFIHVETSPVARRNLHDGAAEHGEFLPPPPLGNDEGNASTQEARPTSPLHEKRSNREEPVDGGNDNDEQLKPTTDGPPLLDHNLPAILEEGSSANGSSSGPVDDISSPIDIRPSVGFHRPSSQRSLASREDDIVRMSQELDDLLFDEKDRMFERHKLRLERDKMTAQIKRASEEERSQKLRCQKLVREGERLQLHGRAVEREKEEYEELCRKMQERIHEMRSMLAAKRG